MEISTTTNYGKGKKRGVRSGKESVYRAKKPFRGNDFTACGVGPFIWRKGGKRGNRPIRYFENLKRKRCSCRGHISQIKGIAVENPDFSVAVEGGSKENAQLPGSLDYLE